MKQLPEFKIRCSSLGKIMAGVSRTGLTDKQKEELATLLAKIKLTEKQAIRRDELIEKRDSKPTLSAGAKTEVEKLVNAWYLNYSKAQLFSSKQTEKGNLSEESAIKFLGEYMFDEFEKNELYFSNEFIHGTPDIIKNKTIRDIKCPWSKQTMPLTKKDAYNVDYEWQMRGYMWLTESNEAFIHYVLMDTPKHLIYDEDVSLHEMSDIADERRVFTIKFNRNTELEEAIKNQVLLCNDYTQEYYQTIINDSKYI